MKIFFMLGAIYLGIILLLGALAVALLNQKGWIKKTISLGFLSGLILGVAGKGLLQGVVSGLVLSALIVFSAWVIKYNFKRGWDHWQKLIKK